MFEKIAYALICTGLFAAVLWMFGAAFDAEFADTSPVCKNIQCSK